MGGKDWKRLNKLKSQREGEGKIEKEEGNTDFALLYLLEWRKHFFFKSLTSTKHGLNSFKYYAAKQ